MGAVYDLDEVMQKVTEVLVNNLKKEVKREFERDIFPKIEALDLDDRAKEIIKKAVIDSFDLGLSFIDYIQENEDFRIKVEKL